MRVSKLIRILSQTPPEVLQKILDEFHAQKAEQTK